MSKFLIDFGNMPQELKDRLHVSGYETITIAKQEIAFKQANWVNLPYLANLPKGATIVIGQFWSYVYKYDLY